MRKTHQNFLQDHHGTQYIGTPDPDYIARIAREAIEKRQYAEKQAAIIEAARQAEIERWRKLLLVRKMKNLTNNDNMWNMQELIMNHWELAGDSKNKLLPMITAPPVPEGFTSRLNNQNRLFYPMPITSEVDEAFSQYIHELNMVNWDIRSKLRDYETFRTGRYHGMKLFKYIKKQGILSPDAMERVTSRKINGGVFLCVSKNPVDYLFCSTNQSFTSCLNLISEYPYYLGLPHYMADRNIFMIFMTTGKLKRYNVKNMSFRHFNILSRTWGVWTRDNKMHLMKYYPSFSIDFQPFLEKVDIEVQPPDSYWESKHPMAEVFFRNYNRVMPFIDNVKGCERYISDGESECGMGVKHKKGFENFNNIDDCGGAICISCDDTIQTDEERYWHDNGPYCEHCYNEHYSYCPWCDDYAPNDDMYHVESHSEHWCRSCVDECTFICDDCGNRNHTDDRYSDSEDDFEYCENCYEKHLLICDECEELTQKDDMAITSDDKFMCSYCYGNTTIQCYKCGDIYSNSYDLHETDDNDSLCDDCYEHAYHCDECGAVYTDKDEVEDTDDGMYCKDCHNDKLKNELEEERLKEYKQLALEEVA